MLSLFNCERKWGTAPACVAFSGHKVDSIFHSFSSVGSAQEGFDPFYRDVAFRVIWGR